MRMTKEGDVSILYNIILYTIDCPKCIILDEKLNKKGIQYSVSKDKEEMKKLGITKCPVLSINGELLDFEQAVVWVNGR